MIFFKNKKLLNYIVVILFSYLYVSTTLFSQIKVYPKIINSDTIDFGIRYFENDEVIRNIVIENNSNDTLFIGNVAPTFATVEAKGFGDTHLAFDRNDNKEFKIIPNSTKELELKFFNNENLIQNKGNMAAFLYIGLAKRLNDPNSLVYQDTFFLYGRASEKLFTVYDKEINFDSTFINSNIAIEKNIYFRNNSDFNFIKFVDLEFDLFTSQTKGVEFIYLTPNFPILLASKSVPGQAPENLLIKYHPKDIGFDSCRFIFKADLGEFLTDSIVYDTSIVKGYGVQFDYELVNTNFNFSNVPFIEVNLGDIRTNEFINFNFEIKNKSNTIINIDSVFFESEKITINSDNHINNIGLNESVNFDYEIMLKEKGLFEETLLLRTDFNKRNILGYDNKSFGFVKLKLKGRGIEPRINIPFDTLYLGNVNLSPECDDIISYKLSLENIGNSELEIIDYIIEDIINFNVEIEKEIINENDKLNIDILFDPINKNNFKNYVSKITLITNMSSPNDSISFYISANLIKSTEVNLSIESLKFKPGNQIKIPINISNGNITSSNRFSGTLSFDNKLLDFVELSTDNTAIEDSDNFNNIIELDGKVYLDIQMPSGIQFKNKTIFLKIIFDTYISTDRNSSIIIENPKFGNLDCDNIFPVTLQSSIVTADSIPNIDNIYYDFSNKIEVNLFPNPSNSIINLELYINNEKIDISKIELFDIFGSKVSCNIIYNNGFTYLDLSELQIGVYHLKVNDIYYSKIIKN